jgi:hypothetical protein
MCEDSFYVKPSHQRLGWGKYCSQSCKRKAQFRGKYFPCHKCQTPTYRSLSKIKHSKSGLFFCSKRCQTFWRNKYFIQEKHQNWNGGKNVYRDILIRSKKRKICLGCGITDARVLAAHHIDNNRKNNHLSNLTWACHNCHFLLHHDVEYKKYFEEKIR